MNGNERIEREGLPDNIYDICHRLGFNLYEARAYIALCAFGRLKMGRLAKLSTVPQSKIYDTIENLEYKGAVVSENDGIRTAVAVPIDEILADRIGQAKKDTEKLLGYIDVVQKLNMQGHLRRLAIPMPA